MLVMLFAVRDLQPTTGGWSKCLGFILGEFWCLKLANLAGQKMTKPTKEVFSFFRELTLFIKTGNTRTPQIWSHFGQPLTAGCSIGQNLKPSKSATFSFLIVFSDLTSVSALVELECCRRGISILCPPWSVQRKLHFCQIGGSGDMSTVFIYVDGCNVGNRNF